MRTKKPAKNWLDVPLVELQRQAMEMGFVLRVQIVPKEFEDKPQVQPRQKRKP